MDSKDSFVPDDGQWHSVQMYWDGNGRYVVTVDGNVVDGDPRLLPTEDDVAE